MAKYDEKFKQAVVQAYLSGPLGAKAVAKAYGVDHGAVRRWVHGYQQHGETGLRKKVSRYDLPFKMSVLSRMQQEDLSCRQAAALFDIRGGGGVIRTWERQYHEGGPQALEPKPRGRLKKMSAPKPPKPSSTPVDESQALKALRKENEYLRAEVAYLKKLDALVRAKQQATPTKRKP